METKLNCLKTDLWILSYHGCRLVSSTITGNGCYFASYRR